MAHSSFTPDYFKIQKINGKIHLFEAIKDENLPLTFNQLMKYDGAIETVFIFNEDAVEVPALLSYCHYFKVKIFLLATEDIKDIKSEIKFAQMMCIPQGSPASIVISKKLLGLDFQDAFCKVSIK